MEVADLLSKWNLADYIQVFQDQHLDYEALMDLTESLARDVVPILGHRIRLLREISKLKNDPELATSLRLGSSSLHPVTSTPNSSGPRISTPPSSPSTRIDQTSSPRRIIADSDEEDFENCPAAALSWETLEKISQPNAVQQALLNRKPDALRILSNYPASKKQFRVRKGKKREKTFEGLDIYHKRLLCDILVKEHCKDIHNLRNVTSLVDNLCRDIRATFPKEDESQYYIPFRSVKVDGKVVKRVNAKGKLYNKFTNYLRILREEYVTPGSDPITLNTTVPVLSANVDASLAWLEKRVEICGRLKDEWDSTRDARINTLRNKVDSNGKNFLESYIHSQYPFLKQPNGYLLLLEDFDALYPDKKNCLFLEWTSFSDNVKKLANADAEISDSEVLYLLGDLFEEEGLTTVPVTKKYRAGKHEMLQSFLFQVETVADIDTEISCHIKKASSNKTTVQPYAIAVGPWPYPTQFYIWYAGVLHKVDSVRDAIDVTFKIFHALHADYPKSSACFWMLLQHHIYNIQTPWDVVMPEAAALASKLQF